MIIEEIKNRLMQLAFQMKNTNVSGVTLYEKIVDDVFYVIVLVELLHGDELTSEQYQNICRKIRSHYSNTGNAINLLGVVCTNNAEAGRTFCVEENTNWLVDLQRRELMIYENQSMYFLNLKEEIEQVLEEMQVNLGQSVYAKQRRYQIPICTIGLVAINVIVFLLMEFSKGTDNIDYMVQCGALEYDHIVNGHEYYRFFTSMFLHFGAEHLFNNTLVLFIIGERLEAVVGRLRFLFLYLASGIVAAIGSFGYNVYTDQLNIVSVGASGAIFGIIGSIAMIIVLHKGRVTGISPGQMVLFVFLSLYSGYTAENVDNVAHIAGLLAGCVWMIIINITLKRRMRRIKDGVK